MCKQVLWTPYKATGICLKNDFPEDIDTTETYSYESFAETPCTERKCEKVNFRWTRRTPGCAYKGYTYLGQIDASRNSHRMRRYDNDIRNCVDVCVDMLVEGKLGPVNPACIK